MTAPITIGIMYPAAWEVRPRAELEQDFELLRTVVPGAEIVDVRYVDPDDLRVRRSSDPSADLRGEAPALTDEQRDAFGRVDVVLAQDLPFDVATVAPKLRWVQGMGAGVGQLVSAGLADAGIRLTTAAGNNAVSIAEFVLGRILTHWKHERALDDQQAAHQWSALYGRELAGATVGVLGLGAIGSQVARRLRAFDVTVLATRRSYAPGMTAPDVDELFGPDQLHEVLGRCDAVVAAVPETADSVDTMDAAAFAAMKPGAFFVNVGRGSFVVESALIEALRSGQLGGAALDVARTEPLPADDPLWDAPNLYLSGHCASSGDRFYANLYRLFADNLQRFLAGEPLRNEVDPAKGY
jgi:phosphoglycerate dehydrogenase-like enzyme